MAILGLVALTMSKIRLAKIRKQEAEAKTRLFHFMQQNKELQQKHETSEKAVMDYAQHLSDALNKDALVMRRLEIYLGNKGDKLCLSALNTAVFGNNDPWEALMKVFDTLYPEVRKNLAAQYPEVHGIKFRRNYGKSPALYCGFDKAEGDVVITMDADLQDSPDEIPELYQMITVEGYDLVSGYKMNRRKGDPLSKTIPTKLFNATARKVSGIHNLHDFNCGLKAYRKDVIKSIEVYGEMHRYIPYLAKNAGFTKIGEKRVHHQARQHGVSKFMGWNRFVNGYLDLMSLWFISTFGRKPMHVFGFLGSIMFFIGLVAAIAVGAYKLICLYNGSNPGLVTESPYFYISLTTMLIGTQLFLAGFLGDMISRNSAERNNYQISKVI